MLGAGDWGVDPKRFLVFKKLEVKWKRHVLHHEVGIRIEIPMLENGRGNDQSCMRGEGTCSHRSDIYREINININIKYITKYTYFVISL